MKPYVQLIVTALAMSAAVRAQAEPTLYPKDLSVLSSIRNVTSSNIVADFADPKTVWVMPPNTAKATVSGLHSLTANMGFCKEMQDEQTYSRQLAGEITTLMKQREQKQGQIDALQAKADKLNQDAESYATTNDLGALDDLDTRIATIEATLTLLNQEEQSCTKDCDGIEQSITDSNNTRRVMLAKRNQLAAKNAQASMIYNSKRNAAKAAQKTVDDAKQSSLDLMAQVNKTRADYLAAYAQFGQMEGGRAGIVYHSDWDNNVAALRQQNPGINFSKISTQNATLMTVLAGISDVDTDSAIKTIEVPGSAKNGAASYPSYPESLAANVVLSLIGACPIEHPDYFDLKPQDVQNMEYGIVITYDYQTVFTAKATVSYDYYKMYQKIVSYGSSGGFFSSHSWSNTEETSLFRDSFLVKWDDAENTIPQAVKDARELEMRHAVLSRLVTMALPQSPSIAGIVAAAPPSAHGAIVASEELMKACPGNAYCVGGAAVLTVLDAIFGQSSSNASYTNIQQGTLSENYSNTSKITKSWITSYL